MHHVIELHFDEDTQKKIHDVRIALRDEKLISDVSEGIPHMSLSSFDCNGPTYWNKALAKISERKSFYVEFAHFGIFRGDPLVIYLGVTPTETLRHLHEDVHQAAVNGAQNVYEHYIPDRIIFHATLANPVSQDKLGPAIERINKLELPKRGLINRISLVEYSPAVILTTHTFKDVS